jgi:hypothetical protein
MVEGKESRCEMNDKLQKSLSDMVDKITLAGQVNPAATGLIIQRAAKEAYRQHKAATAPDGFERVTYHPTRGPRLSFTGRKIYDWEYNGKSIELCETIGGNLVMFNEWPADGIVPGDMHSVAYRFEGDDYIGVMDALNWSNMARNMAKKLGWKLILEVE